jgi:uncharacterized tellurite resistance protein B-like protein
MLEALSRFFRRITGAAPDSRAPGAGPDELQLAACALLVEMAHADGEFSIQERSQIERALGRHFSLDPPAAQRLLALAERERRRAIDHYRFTKVIRERLDLGQRMVLAEVMWGVAFADGRVADDEAYLLRKLGNLLDLAPGYLAEARRSVLERRGSPPEAR